VKSKANANAKKKIEKKHDELRVEKGMLRYLYIILDCSQAMSKHDLKPNRLVVSQRIIEIFIKEYFDQNPLSQLGIIIGHNKKAFKLTDLGGNPLQQIEKLHSIGDLEK